MAEEMLDFCAQGYWIVLPFDDVQAFPQLRISPLGVVPQRDRRPRLIVDYTFSGVNQDTLPLAPREAMQFGRALQRVLSTIVHADPRFGPVYLAKIDIADGFYRIWLQASDVVKLGVALPLCNPEGRPLVAFPLALPMGWVESPPYFTALTETACDRANTMLRDRDDPRLQDVHRLEAIAATPPPGNDLPCQRTAVTRGPRVSHLGARGRPPVAQVDVYVDDFLLLAQTASQRRLVMRAALSSIDEVLRPLSPSDPPLRKEPASIKKMQKGDACWATEKRVLGWDIDTRALTLSLPPHRLERLNHILDWISSPRRRLHIKRWHQLLGELRSMSIAIPGSRGLFSVLQEALRRADSRRVRLTRKIHEVAADFKWLVASLGARPTRLPELIPTYPSDVGASDACQYGMGGVWFDVLDPTSPPLLWRQRFPPRITASLVTADNPHGEISISDLELAGILAHRDILAHERPIAERTIWINADNRAAVSWSTKGSATSTAARSYLLRHAELHQRAYRYVVRTHYMPGPVNVMADDASRRWDLSDHDLLSHFNTHFPQGRSWQMRTLTPETSALLTGALSRTRAQIASPLNAQPQLIRHGRCGRPSAPAWASIPTPSDPTQFLFSSFSPIGTATAPSPPAVTPFALGQWKMPYERWARRTPAWGPWTLV